MLDWSVFAALLAILQIYNLTERFIDIMHFELNCKDGIWLHTNMLQISHNGLQDGMRAIKQYNLTTVLGIR